LTICGDAAPEPPIERSGRIAWTARQFTLASGMPRLPFQSHAGSDPRISAAKIAEDTSYSKSRPANSKPGAQVS